MNMRRETYLKSWGFLIESKSEYDGSPRFEFGHEEGFNRRAIVSHFISYELNLGYSE